MDIRKCLFCGTDISHKNRNAIICGCQSCTSQYDKWRRELKKNNPHRYCIVCGTCIDNLPPQRKTCLNENCIKTDKSNKYATKLYVKKCEKCGKTFEATAKQKLCEECRNTYHNNFVHKKIKQSVICKDCGKIIEIREKNKNNRTLDIVYELCDDCKFKHKEKFKLEASKRMTNNNPMKDKRVANKMAESLHKHHIEKWIFEGKQIKPITHTKSNDEKETPLETKMRMTLQNPMFRKETREKMSETLKEKIANGEIIYKKGKEHPLWKGNRNFNKSVRVELRKWVKEKFFESNFTCQICGKTKTELHVHHLKPLREIIDDYLNTHNLTIEYLNGIEGSNEYFNIIQEIVNYHNENKDVGIVVCPECHNKLDKQYKRKTHDKKY